MSFFATNGIKPKEWLKKQLEIQAKGLCGNLDKVWPDVRDSAWIGGDREGWERVPYWLDGFIPLAYLLGDEDMISRAKKYIDAIILAQKDDGWICPCTDDERDNYDTWAVLLICKVLCLYCDCSKDNSVIKVIEKCLKQFNSHINHNTMRNWGAARWFEGLISIYWLYEKTGEKWLITLAKKLRVQGFDWRNLFGLEPHFGCCTANFGQGFPKLALSTFFKTEKGIASCVLSPSTVETEINGVKVVCELGILTAVTVTDFQSQQNR